MPMSMSMLLKSRKAFLLTLDPLKQISADLNRANDILNNNINNINIITLLYEGNLCSYYYLPVFAIWKRGG